MPTEVTVDTPSGPVVGRRDGAFLRFGGVPYARAERWGAPEQYGWREPLDATRPGAAPPQTVGGLDLVPDMVPATKTEACLTAEICTPALRSGTEPVLDGSAPVLVWVPGGSYRIGSASLATYDGAHLAAHGVVVIGLNYRLGALGWLAAPGVPSNLGLRDLSGAIDWLRTNVSAFGGDPDRIVLMGESAGSGCIAHLLATGGAPVSGAILQSGAPAGTLDAATAAWVGEQFLDAAGAASTADLASAPVDVLLAAQERTVEASLAKVGMMPFHPWVDDDLLTAPAHRAVLPAIPLVVGTTAHEMELFRDQVPVLPDDIALMFLAGKAANLGITDEARIRAAFDACGNDLVEAVADLELHVPNELLARGHAARGNPVFRYRFAWEAPVRRACHALDLPFTFGTLDASTWREFAGADAARAADADALSARMQQAWTSFAADGAPSDDTIGRWPEDTLVTLGTNELRGDDDVARRVALWLGDA